MAGVPAGGGALLSGAGTGLPVPLFGGAAGRATGGVPGAEGEFLPASAPGGVAVLGGTAAGAAGFFPVAGAVPPVPFFAGAAGRATGGAPGAEGEFRPASVLGGGLGGASALGGAVACAAGFFPAGPRGFPTGPAAPGFPSLVKSGGLVPGGFSPYVCFCSSPNA